MKKVVPLILIFTFITSCNHSGYKKITEYHNMLDSLQINDYDTYSDYKSYISDLRPTKESFCLLDSLKAEIEIKKNKLTYFIGHNRENLGPSLKDFPNYLKQNYNINSIELLVGCIITDNDKYYECYERLMHKAIANKYGNDFIDKSKRIVDSIYIHKNKDIIFTRYNSYAMFNRYKSKTYNNWKDSINQNVIKKINFSELKYDANTNFSVEFIITKSGKVDSLKIHSLRISDKNDTYFKKQLKEYVLKTKWQPVELYGIKLNTKEYIFI